MKNCLTLASLLAVMPLAHAADNLEPLIVTTGYPTELDQSLASVEIIGREDIESSAASDLADLLKFHAGLEIGRNGGPGQATSLFIRGTESDHALILIDGVPINSGSLGTAALQHIDPQLIERIEIYKGPRSTLWGSGAIGGVINIITRQVGGEGNQFHASLEGGGQGTARGSGLVSHRSRNAEISASISYQRSDGFPTLSTSDLDRGYRNTSFNLDASTEIQGHKLTVSHWQTQGLTEYLDYFANPLDQDFLNSRSSLGWAIKPTDNWHTSLSFGFVRDYLDENQSNQFVHTDRSEWGWKNHLQLNADVLSAGLKYTDESVEAQGGFSPYKADTRIFEAWGQYELNAGRHHALAGLRYLDHETAGSHWTWSLNYGIDLNNDSRLFVNGASGFRVPSANERFGFGGNPDLEPEESLSFELGIRHRLNHGHLLQVALYQNDIDNLIQWVMVTPPWYGYNQNIARTRIRGLELSYDYSADAFDFSLGGNWQDPQNRDTDGPLLRRARYSLNARLAYHWNNWRFDLDALHSGKREDFGGVILDSYSLVNVNVRYRLNTDWSLYARAENLFDEDYQLAAGYNTQGRLLSLGIRYR